MLYQTILCATDGREHSERAMRRAAVIARETGAELHVVNVEETEPAPMRMKSDLKAPSSSECDCNIEPWFNAAPSPISTSVRSLILTPSS